MSKESKGNRSYEKLLLSTIILGRGVNTVFFVRVACLQRGGVSVLRRFVIRYPVLY